MQKPVNQLLPTPPSLQPAVESNLTSALRVALLLLPPTFTDFELFTMVAGLSYRGDFRMTFGENPQKVKNIVAGSLPHFHSLYEPLLRDPTRLAPVALTATGHTLTR